MLAIAVMAAVPEWLTDVGTIAMVAGAVLALAGSVVGGFWWLVLPRIVDSIEARTEPIQPSTNGGKSLADVNEKADAILAQQQHILTRVDAMDQRLLRVEHRQGPRRPTRWFR